MRSNSEHSALYQVKNKSQNQMLISKLQRGVPFILLSSTPSAEGLPTTSQKYQAKKYFFPAYHLYFSLKIYHEMWTYQHEYFMVWYVNLS